MTTTAASPRLDDAKLEAFGRKMSDALNAAALTLMASAGHRTGLFDALARLTEPADAGRIAAESGLNERYVREWLGAMTAAGVVEYDPEAGRYHLPPEHAAWLARGAGPANLAASSQWVAVLGGVEDRIVEAFRHGRGVPYAAYNRFHEVMAEESQQTVVDPLLDHILPLVPGLVDRLNRGIDALDVACGAGRAVIRMAEAFPASRFAGYDLAPEAIALARAEADRRGLRNARFEVVDLATLDAPGSFDLVTAFDAIHDQARPAEVLRAIARALRPGGTFLMQEIAGTGHVHRDAEHPFGTFLYSISCMHCMSVSLANGGPGLGAMWGRELAERMLAEAGFAPARVESLPHDPMNLYYVTGPAGA